MPLIWVPKSNPNPNPNPNPNISATPKPSSSSSNPPKINTKKKKKKNKNKNKPNWLQLPEDLWLLILSKLDTIHIIENVQKVCRLFRKICIQPAMFRVIDMTLPDAYMFLNFDANVITRYAVDRSAGELVDVYVEFCCDDDTLMYIVDRSKNLKHLRIGHYIPISDEALLDAVRKLPMLEEVEIIISGYHDKTYEALGHACPSLKSFSLNSVASRCNHNRYIGNEEVFAISKSMPTLRRLQLIGNSMSNEGLKAILDGCPLLETLDLRACFNIDLSGALGKRCAMIRHLRRPNDSTSDYSHQACAEDHPMGDYFFDESDYDSDDWGDFEDFYPDSDFDLFHDYYDGFDDFVDYALFAGGFFPGFGSDSD